MTNGIDRAFGGGIDRGDTDIHGIQAVICAWREIPLRGAGGRCGERVGVTHHIALGTASRNLKPTFHWIFYEVYRAIIHDETGGRLGWIGKLIT